MEDFLNNADLLLAWLFANMGTLTTVAITIAGAYFAIKARRETSAKRFLMDGIDNRDNLVGAVVVEAQRAGVVHPADVARITLGALKDRAKAKRMGAIDREAKARKRADAKN